MLLWLEQKREGRRIEQMEGGKEDWTESWRAEGERERERINTILQQEKSRSQSVNR